jgi:phosphohistidine phosphatase
MHTLILMRHAKAVRPETAPDDESRGLTARGETEALAAGLALKDLNLGVNRVLVSPAARTQQTAARVVPALGPVSVETVASLYLAEAEHIFAEAMAKAGDVTLVIGHNPGLHECAVRLLEQEQAWSQLAVAVRTGFPTSAFAAFSLRGDVLEAAGPSLVAAWQPRD